MSTTDEKLERIEGETALSRITNDPVSRRKFVAMSGGSVVGLGAFLAACGGDDEESTSTSSSTEETTTTDMASMFGEGDLGIVNYALTLEYLEADFYNQVADSGLFKGDALMTIKVFGANEQAHVDALKQTAMSLGDPAPEVKGKFPLDDAESVLELAATVENIGAAAYLGQAAAIEDPKILAAALSIHTVEARHAAALNMLVDKPITPDGAFAVPLTMEDVLAEVKPFLQ